MGDNSSHVTNPSHLIYLWQSQIMLANFNTVIIIIILNFNKYNSILLLLSTWSTIIPIKLILTCL